MSQRRTDDDGKGLKEIGIRIFQRAERYAVKATIWNDCEHAVGIEQAADWFDEDLVQALGIRRDWLFRPYLRKKFTSLILKRHARDCNRTSLEVFVRDNPNQQSIR